MNDTVLDCLLDDLFETSVQDEKRSDIGIWAVCGGVFVGVAFIGVGVTMGWSLCKDNSFFKFTFSSFKMLISRCKTSICSLR